MAFDAHVVEVLIASPGNTGRGRAAIEKALRSWNATSAQDSGIVLVPAENHHPRIIELDNLGSPVITAQAVDTCDLVIALFDGYLGTDIDAAAAETAGELLRAYRAGKPVHVWFSMKRVPGVACAALRARANDVARGLQREGILPRSYAHAEDLHAQALEALERDMPRLKGSV
jgi:hypothetical protein